MRKARLAFLLLSLVLWTQVDDAWVSAIISPLNPLAAEDDEFLSLEKRQSQESSTARQKQARPGPKPRTASLFADHPQLPSETKLAAPFTPPSLYVFMSMQC